MKLYGRVRNEILEKKNRIYDGYYAVKHGGIAGNMGSEIVLAEEVRKSEKGLGMRSRSFPLPEENCKAVIDICFLEDGTMRISYRGQCEAKLKTADSKGSGKKLETPRDLWEEFGKSEKAEPMTVNLLKDGGIFSSWNCLEGENFSGSLPFSGRNQKEFDLTPDAGRTGICV